MQRQYAFKPGKLFTDIASSQTLTGLFLFLIENRIKRCLQLQVALPGKGLPANYGCRGDKKTETGDHSPASVLVSYQSCRL